MPIDLAPIVSTEEDYEDEVMTMHCQHQDDTRMRK